MEKRDLLRALWLAAEANGGTLRIGPSTIQKYPGDKLAVITTRMDQNFGEMVISANIIRDSQ